jgi:hypothetical protein
VVARVFTAAEVVTRGAVVVWNGGITHSASAR